MSKLFDDASLAMIPSAYKDGKLYSIRPTDGDGDFTFSRGTTATRVDVNGLIEKGRENHLLHSNNFGSGAWVKNGTSVTSGQGGYDGTSDAWKLNITTSNSRHNIIRIFNLSGIVNFSIYAKAGELQYLQIASAQTAADYANFDLSDGSIGNVGSDFFNATATSVGGGWYRLSVTSKIGMNGMYISLISSKTSSWLETFAGSSATDGLYIQDGQVEQGLVATDYIETGASTAQAGILEDMPRLDYSGGASCPALLLEPQRTNYLASSEYISNWQLIGSVTATANYGTSPEGVQNSTRLVFTGASQEARKAATSVTGCVASIYVKGTSGETIKFGSTGSEELFTLNGSWQRIDKYNSGSPTNITINTYSGATARDIEVWGAQVEQGSYPTSYIPTYGASVTRSADETDTTFATPIDTNGGFTLFMHYDGNGVTSTGGASSTAVLRFQDDNNQYLGLVCTDRWRLRITGSFGTEIRTSPYDTTEEVKLLIRSDESGWEMYANGASYASGTDSVSWGDIYYLIHNPADVRSKHPVKQWSIFPTALTDSECIALTTI